ncbi:MAG: beta-glucosidase [bacterium]|nr:beta-glucosidase [bacterium]
MEARIEQWLAEMSLDEKVEMLAGSDMWHAPGVERLGIPPIKVTDGPNGARGGAFRGAMTSACFPCGSALGATWNPDLLERVGVALAEETRTKSAHVLLAPTVNIQRSPLAGRNFECYSEDPYLSARLAVRFVQGVQSQGIGTTVKHYVANDSEFERHTISSEVGERALREIYLPPFEAAVCEAEAWGIMSAYNKINGTWASEHDRLLNTVLRDEWGFDGFVISDWFGSNSSAGCANGGLDLEMPGPARHYGDKLLEAIRSGEVTEATIDQKVRRLLLLRDRVGVFEDPEEKPEQAIDRPEHRELAREAAAESFVLLKNDTAVLPLDPQKLQRVAVIGPNADVAVVHGGGSAQVKAHYRVSALEGIRDRLPDLEILHEPGCTNHKLTPALDNRYLSHSEGEAGLRVEYFNNTELEGDPAFVTNMSEAELTWFGEVAKGVEPSAFSARITGTLVAPESGAHTFSLTSAGKTRILVDGELVVDNWTQQTRGESFFGAGTIEVSASVKLKQGQSYDVQIDYSRQDAPVIAGLRAGLLLPVPEDLMERAVAAADRADVAIVVVGLNPDWESEGRDRLDMELPGRQVELIERIAAANPRTIVVLNAGSPLRMEWLSKVPAVLQIWYPGQELGNALAEVLVGDRDAGGRLPLSLPKRLEDNPAFINYPGEKGQVFYGEGVFVGYRYYDTKDVEPLFPFGHGLSYGSFEYDRMSLSAREIGPGDGIEVRVDVRNTGSRVAQEVVQVYVSDPEASIARPEQELRAFEKLLLRAGESRTLSLQLGPRAFSFFDVTTAGWVAEPGAFEVRVGRSSRDIRARASFELKS